MDLNKRASDRRPICKSCSQRHVGINYKRNGKTYYRSKCDSCIREAKKNKPAVPNWARGGYKKKMECDLCHFKARWGKQIIVYYVDGDLKSTQLNNLKSICLNCAVVVEKQDMPWAKDLGLNADN
jgi:hypothetical protein